MGEKEDTGSPRTKVLLLREPPSIEKKKIPRAYIYTCWLIDYTHVLLSLGTTSSTAPRATVIICDNKGSCLETFLLLLILVDLQPYKVILPLF